jgi:hypothetical protein
MATKKRPSGKSSGDSGSGDSVGKGEFRSSPRVRTGLINGHTFGVKAVQYAEVNGQAIFEGDIILGTVEEVEQKTNDLRAVASGEVALGVIITGSQFRWPNCKVPYTIDPTLPNQARVTDAIAHWEANTNFRFPKRTNEANYVTFRPSDGCSSSVGMRGGQQFVNLAGGCTKGNAIHEIGHTVGLWHEQSREDRDSFVTIHWDKIQAGLSHNFDQHIGDGDDVGAYDYGSIMHYPRDAFSIDGSDTITPIQAGAQIGQRTALSAGDINAAKTLCPGGIVKSPIIDTVTKKETMKDQIFDTKKELIFDTKKEIVFDTKKEIVETLKEGSLDPIKRGGDVINPGPITTLPGKTTFGGAVPFAVAAPHQAPGAMGDQDNSGTIEQLDAQLQALADALAETDANRNHLQQQYDETQAMLKQILDA